MKRGHTISTAPILLASILALTCIGCRDAQAERPTGDTETVSDHRFSVTHREALGVRSIRVITDTETGVQYLVYSDNNGIGLTKLEAPEEETP